MSILGKMAGGVIPEFTVESTVKQDFTLEVVANVVGWGKRTTITDLEPLYQLFKDRMLAEEFESE